MIDVETEHNGGAASSAPATKADISLVKADINLVLAEIRALRIWAEGKFEAMEQRFIALEHRVGVLETGAEKLTNALGWRLTVLNVTIVGAIFGAGVLS